MSSDLACTNSHGLPRTIQTSFNGRNGWTWQLNEPNPVEAPMLGCRALAAMAWLALCAADESGEPGEASEAGESECPMLEKRELIRQSYFQAEGGWLAPTMIGLYLLLWLGVAVDVVLLLRARRWMAEEERGSGALKLLPVMPSLWARLGIHLRRARQQMTGVHAMAGLITIAILYSEGLSKLFTSIYYAITNHKSETECPENTCSYGGPEEVESPSKWAVIVPAYVTAVSFTAAVACLRRHAQEKNLSIWMTFSAGFIGHVIGFRWKDIIEKLYDDYLNGTSFLDMYAFRGFFIQAWMPFQGGEGNVDEFGSLSGGVAQPDTASMGFLGYMDGLLSWDSFPGWRPYLYPYNQTCVPGNWLGKSEADYLSDFGDNFWCGTTSGAPGNIIGKSNVTAIKAENMIRGWWFKDAAYQAELGHRIGKAVLFTAMSLAVLIAWRYLMELRRTQVLEKLQGKLNDDPADDVQVHTNQLVEMQVQDKSNDTVPTGGTPDGLKSGLGQTDAEIQGQESNSGPQSRVDEYVIAATLAEGPLRETLNDSMGLAIGWLLAKLAYWIIYGLAVFAAGTHGWVGFGTGHFLTKFVIFILFARILASCLFKALSWISRRNSAESEGKLWLSGYWSGVEEVIAEWTMGYLVFLFLQQEIFFMGAAKKNFAHANSAACIYGTTTFTGSYPQAETMTELPDMLSQLICSVPLLMIYLIAIDNGAVEAEMHSTWMAHVARVVQVADTEQSADPALAAQVQSAARIHPDDQQHLQSYVLMQAQRSNQNDRRIRFTLGYAGIQAALAFETFIDNFVEVFGGCSVHMFYESEAACERQGLAELAIVQALIFFLLATVLTVLSVCLLRFILIPYGLVNAEEEHLEVVGTTGTDAEVKPDLGAHELSTEPNNSDFPAKREHGEPEEPGGGPPPAGADSIAMI